MQLNRGLIYLLLIIITISCEEESTKSGLKTGMWRGELVAQNNRIPFNFEISKKDNVYKINLINGDEKLEIDNINLIGDSLYFNMHIFDISIKAKLNDTILTGSYTKNYAKDYVLPFKAVYGKNNRFDNINSTSIFDGKWETTFTNSEGKETNAIGIFKKDQNKLKGTFLTKTGDYRFLDGYTKNDSMYLYTFDGNHIYKFSAKKENDTLIKGEYWSGKTSYKTFVAVKNENAELPNANELTFLKEGFDKIEITFPGLDGNPVSLSDKKYQNKVIILQILGTWCPNCMDETKFYSEWYNKNKGKNVEIIGLAYEVKPDFEYAKKRVQTMKEKLNVNYDFVIAGTSTTKSASESLPMLNKVISFPTSIIIDKKGKVRRIHTGFSGPATGVYYEEFVDDFNQLMKELIDE